jgi:hypothetical protein
VYTRKWSVVNRPLERAASQTASWSGPALNLATILVMVFSAIASVLSLAFAVVVFLRFRKSRRPAFAAWTLGLLIFAGAAAFQAAGETGGWTAITFRGFYLLGGVLGVIYLALGTIFLLTPRRFAWGCAIVLAVITIVLAVDAAVIPVDVAKLTTAKGVLGDAIQQGSLLFIGVVFLNIIGTLVLVGGSGWSAYRFIRDRAGIDRVICNVLLTSGALIIAVGFSAAKTVGIGNLDILGVYETVGIAIMFAGFLALGRVGVRHTATGPATVASGS